MIYRIQPANEITFANSPIIIDIFEDAYAEANFFYYLDIFVWQGDPLQKPAQPNYTLRKRPDIYDGNSAKFDVSPMILSEITDNYTPDTDVLFNEGEDQVYWEVGARYISDSSSSLGLPSNTYFATKRLILKSKTCYVLF